MSLYQREALIKKCLTKPLKTEARNATRPLINCNGYNLMV